MKVVNYILDKTACMKNITLCNISHVILNTTRIFSNFLNLSFVINNIDLCIEKKFVTANTLSLSKYIIPKIHKIHLIRAQELSNIILFGEK